MSDVIFTEMMRNAQIFNVFFLNALVDLLKVTSILFSSYYGISYALVNKLGVADPSNPSFDYSKVISHPEIYAKIYRNKQMKQPICALFERETKVVKSLQSKNQPGEHADAVEGEATDVAAASVREKVKLIRLGYEARDEYLQLIENHGRPEVEVGESYLYFEGRNIITNEELPEIPTLLTPSPTPVALPSVLADNDDADLPELEDGEQQRKQEQQENTVEMSQSSGLIVKTFDGSDSLSKSVVVSAILKSIKEEAVDLASKKLGIPHDTPFNTTDLVQSGKRHTKHHRKKQKNRQQRMKAKRESNRRKGIRKESVMRLTAINEDEVLWVFTVPAYWTEADKSFLQNTAYLSGMITEPDAPDLLILTAPECAIRSLMSEITPFVVGHTDSRHQLLAPNQSQKSVATPHGLSVTKGDKLIALDVGGEKTGVSVYEVIDIGLKVNAGSLIRGDSDLDRHASKEAGNMLKLKSVLDPYGLKVGSHLVNAEFHKFLEKLFKDSNLELLKRSEIGQAALLKLFSDFEEMKKAVRFKGAMLENFASFYDPTASYKYSVPAKSGAGAENGTLHLDFSRILEAIDVELGIIEDEKARTEEEEQQPLLNEPSGLRFEGLDTLPKSSKKPWLSDAGSDDEDEEMRISLTDILEEFKHEYFPGSSGYENLKGNPEDVILSQYVNDLKTAGSEDYQTSLVMPVGLVHYFFLAATKPILAAFGALLKRPSASSAKFVVLFGGFSMNSLLRTEMKQMLASAGHKATILVPKQSQITLQKGAVLLGFDSSSLSVEDYQPISTSSGDHSENVLQGEVTSTLKSNLQIAEALMNGKNQFPPPFRMKSGREELETLRRMKCTPAYEKRVVVAIDFGSTNCGTAYSFVNLLGVADPTNPEFDYKAIVEKPAIFMRRCRGKYEKEPTCALFSRKKETLMKFGYDASESYLSLVASGDDDRLFKYLYFEGRDIKLRLWEKSESYEEKEVSTQDRNDSLSLKEVVSGIFTFLRTEVLEQCHELLRREYQTYDTQSVNNGIEEPKKIAADQVLWVLTVPPNWKSKQRDFMREAALTAGLVQNKQSSDLIFALEPECALIAASQSIKHLNKGDKIVTLDCGGVTVDVCAVEALRPYSKMAIDDSRFLRFGHVIEPYSIEGGSCYIDKLFLSFLEVFLEDPSLERLRASNPAVITEILTEFEGVKVSMTSQEYRTQEGSRPMNFTGILRAINEENKLNNNWNVFQRQKEGSEEQDGEPTTTLVRLSEIVDHYNGNVNARHEFGDITLECTGVKGYETHLVVPMKLIRTFFQQPVAKILEEVERLLDNVELYTLKYVLLLGGFAQSSVLKDELAEKLKSIDKTAKLWRPRFPSTMIQKGAVLYGFDPNVISTKHKMMPRQNQSSEKQSKGDVAEDR